MAMAALAQKDGSGMDGQSRLEGAIASGPSIPSYSHVIGIDSNHSITILVKDQGGSCKAGKDVNSKGLCPPTQPSGQLGEGADAILPPIPHHLILGKRNGQS
jgi:hypothetical protein